MRRQRAGLQRLDRAGERRIVGKMTSREAGGAGNEADRGLKKRRWGRTSKALWQKLAGLKDLILNGGRLGRLWSLAATKALTDRVGGVCAECN